MCHGFLPSFDIPGSLEFISNEKQSKTTIRVKFNEIRHLFLREKRRVTDIYALGNGAISSTRRANIDKSESNCFRKD